MTAILSVMAHSARTCLGDASSLLKPQVLPAEPCGGGCSANLAQSPHLGVIQELLPTSRLARLRNLVKALSKMGR